MIIWVTTALGSKLWLISMRCWILSTGSACPIVEGIVLQLIWSPDQCGVYIQLFWPEHDRNRWYAWAEARTIVKFPRAIEIYLMHELYRTFPFWRIAWYGSVRVNEFETHDFENKKQGDIEVEVNRSPVTRPPERGIDSSVNKGIWEFGKLRNAVTLITRPGLIIVL